MKWFWERNAITLALLPFSCVFYLITALRRKLYQWGVLSSKKFPVPIIVVGNITVGGTGKTPTVIALCHYLQLLGYYPGVVSRGYKGQAKQYPMTVSKALSPKECGDEPWLIHQKTNCPVVVDPKRVRAVRHLLREERCDVIISDDGLQHYALQRDIEIALINGKTGLGNGYLLPAGPLREPSSRLETVDFVLHKNPQADETYGVVVRLDSLYQLRSNEKQSVADWCGKRVHAVAGISFPQQFFDQLTALGLKVTPHAFPDHHAFEVSDFDFESDDPVIMTEKDAIKCQSFAKENWYALAISVRLPSLMLEELKARLARMYHE